LKYQLYKPVMNRLTHKSILTFLSLIYKL